MDFWDALLSDGASGLKKKSNNFSQDGMIFVEIFVCSFKLIDIIVSELPALINGPFTPDLCNTLDSLPEMVRERDWPMDVSAATLIGSCTNSSCEDMTRAADLCQQAMDAGLKVKVPFLVTPGSEQVRATIEKDGIAEVFRKAGGM